jgi:tetratricopeptide (TPR) repeat protein
LEFNKLGMDLATKINHRRYQVRALLKRALIESMLGKYHESIMHLREVQKLARVTGRVNEECSSVADEAIPLCRLGKFTEALECAAQGHELLVKSGLEGSDIELGFLDRKAEIHFQKTEYTEARRLTERVVRMTGRHCSPYFHANAVRTLAQIDIITGVEDSVILQTLIAARELAKELRWPHALVMCDISQCELDIRSGNGAKAYTSLKCLVTNAELDAEVMFLTLESLGELSHGLCGVDETFSWATTYFAFARKTQDLGHTYQALRYLGDTFLAQGDEETALNVFQTVLDGSTKMDVHRRRADCMSRIGDILLCRDDLVRAKEMWETARPLFVRSSRAKDATTVESKLAQLVDKEPTVLPNPVRISVVLDDETAKDISSCQIIGRQSVNQL